MPTHSWRRSLGLALPVVLGLSLLLGAFGGTDHAAASGSRHPYFNDGGTLRWHHSIAAARSAARSEGKLIFVEYGRRRCSNCKKLAERILPHRSIRGRLSRLAVGLAAECDRPEREIYSMFRRNLPGARTLPFVAFLTPDGDWITGWAGYRNLNAVSSTLSHAESRHTQLMAARHSPRPSQPPAPVTQARRAGPQNAPITPTARPTTTPTPAPAVQEEDPCAGGACEGGSCDAGPGCVPFQIPNPFKLLTRKCKPCPPCTPNAATPPATHARGAGAPVAEACPDFPAPAARAQAAPQLANRSELPCAVGSPDGAPAPTAQGAEPVLPAPMIRRSSNPPHIAAGDPDGNAAPSHEAPLPAAPRRHLPTMEAPRMRAPAVTATERHPGARSASHAQALATKAAARGDWAAVLRYTQGASRDRQPLLFALNGKAHTWAHGRLAHAVRALRDQRFDVAFDAVKEVQQVMRGQAEAIDAERGAEAIELMRDIAPLAADSMVRRTVRKTAYEKMRGTRWAPLFSPVPEAGAVVAAR